MRPPGAGAGPDSCPPPFVIGRLLWYNEGGSQMRIWRADVPGKAFPGQGARRRATEAAAWARYPSGGGGRQHGGPAGNLGETCDGWAGRDRRRVLWPRVLGVKEVIREPFRLYVWAAVGSFHG